MCNSRHCTLCCASRSGTPAASRLASNEKARLEAQYENRLRELDNLLAAEPAGVEPFYYFNGAPYTYAEAVNDLKGIWKKLKDDLQAASYPTTYYQSTPRGRELDNMSIIDWLNESVPGGATSRLGRLLDVAYNIEIGRAHV